MTNETHLNALEHRLHNERARLVAAKSAGERELRTVWIAQIEREIAGEKARLGILAVPEDELSDDELLAALGGGSKE